MKSIRILLIAVSLVTLGTCLVPGASAGDWDEKTLLTFDQPVELPGVVLPAGSYIFKLMESPTDRQIVRVLSADEHTVFATINAVSKLRYNTSESTLIVYEDRTAGAPRTIKEWFYPDRMVGHEFVYSGHEPGQLARTEEKAEISSPPESDLKAVTNDEDSSYMQALNQRQSEDSGMAAGNAEAEMPASSSGYMDLLQEKQEEPVALARAEEPEQALGSNDMANVDSHSAIHEMPRTASNLPLLGFSGLAMILAGSGLRLSRKKAN
jgi:hypothetical protein